MLCGSPNPDCDLVYSKSDYVNNDVIAYPSHFEIPKMAYLDEQDEGLAETQPEVEQPCSATDLLTGEGENEPPIGPAAPLDSSPSEHRDTVVDFTNVYITRPPLVAVRDSSRKWYNFPWRVTQSFEGARFLLETYTLASNQPYLLRDRDLGNDLNRQNWEHLAYPGMIIEVLDASGQQDADADAARSPTSKGSAAHRGCNTCRLCGLKCSTQAALGSHVTVHLKNRPCPMECSTCEPNP